MPATAPWSRVCNKLKAANRDVLLFTNHVVIKREPPLRGIEDDASGRSSSHLRIHNLSAVLRLLHDEGPLPRSVITTRTGLNRSTISALVGELVELGYVVEEQGGSGGSAGRPSIHVRPTDGVGALSAQVEIDAIKLAAVGLSGKILQEVRRPLPDAPAARTAIHLITELAQLVRSAIDPNMVICGLGVAVPGQVQDRVGIVTESLPLHWANVKFADELANRLDLPVFVDNDARLSLRTSQLRGIARGEQNVVYLHGRSSGISGGIVADGDLMRGNSGLAGAVGLIRVHTDRVGSLHEHPGTLDALVRRDQIVESLGGREFSDEELGEVLAGKIPGKARRVVDEQSVWLASGLATIINLFNPDTIVLDGFLAPLFRAREESILARCASESVASSFGTVRFVCENLDASTELLGAAELPLQALISAPLDIQKFRTPALRLL